MKALPAEARTQNVSAKNSCRWCGDEGMAPVQVRPAHEHLRCGKHVFAAPANSGYEEFAPCPYCEKGFAVEFPTANPKSGRPTDAGPWGKDGYWRGREQPVDL